jgi:hypothetical protein
VPLAPRETYYGYGNFGRYSVNVRNVNINQVNVTNVYRNVTVVNSITVVNQTTFVTGRPAPVHREVVVNIREDFSHRRGILVGRPQVKPVASSYVPVVRSIPETKRPPATVRKMDVRELRQNRPLIKEPDRSAIRPNAPVRPLAVKKFEKPRPIEERARERRQAPPADRRILGVPKKETPAPAPERGGKPATPAPDRKVMPGEVPKPEKKIEREKPPEAPPARRPFDRFERRDVRPQVTPPAEKAAPGKAAPETHAAPPDQKPEREIERRRAPREVSPEKVQPEPPKRGHERDSDDNVVRGRQIGRAHV